MRVTKKNLHLYLLALAFACVAIWWIFHFPYSRDRLYRAVPADAILVSEHLDVMDRWESAFRNAVVHNILTSFVGPETVEEIVSDPGFRWLVRILGSRIAVTAFSPAFGTSGRESWTFACWAGGYAQLMNWGLLDALLQDFRTIDVGRRKVWTLRCDELEEGAFLSLAVERGIIVGSLSRDPCGAVGPAERVARTSMPLAPLCRRILDGKQGGASSSGGTGVLSRKRLPQVHDRAWMRLDAGDYAKRLGGNLYGEAVLIPPGSLTGSVISEITPSRGSAPLSGEDLDGLGEILGNIPDAIAIAKSGDLNSALCDTEASSVFGEIWGALKDHAAVDAEVFALVAGDEHSGRLMGMRVPALCAGIKLKASDTAGAAIAGLADKLNALYGLGLIPVRASGHPGVTVMDFIRRKSKSVLRPQLRVAFGVRDDWLIGCTSIDTLENMLGAKCDPRGERVTWREELGSCKQTLACGWLDMDETGALVDRALAVYTLLTAFSGKSQTRRLYTEETKAAVRAMRSLGTCTLRLTPVDDRMQLLYELKTESR